MVQQRGPTATITAFSLQLVAYVEEPLRKVWENEASQPEEARLFTFGD